METKDLAPHVLKALFDLQSEGALVNLQTLTDLLRVRRGDIRRVITALHREGYVDAVHMRLTLRGLAVGAAFAQSPLRPLRRVSSRASVQAA
jgi:DNA-binding IclR family transcriptional regulator